MERPMVNKNKAPETLLSFQDGRKRILTDNYGYTKPGELVSIMGASGGGKTSLLNVLAQRLTLSPGASFQGEVKINGRVVGKQDFGKVGAFVQQDDILIETMTPVEALTFAAKLRTNLTESMIQRRVEQIISRLGLQKYEPTSGLDSTTAYNIVKILKKVSQSGITVISTIHQPSSEIFMQFNRLILLHEGYQIYQGPIQEISPYLNSINISLPKFKNPADFLIRLMQNPSSVREDIKISFLAKSYEEKIKPKIENEMDNISSNYEGKSARLTMIAEGRSVSSCKQFIEIFKRDVLNTSRNPRALRATCFNAIFVALLCLALFFKVADINENNSLMTMIFNLLGLSFLLTTNQVMPAFFSVVIQIPLQTPVYQRERSNKMYGTTVYLLGRASSSFILQTIYPLLFTVVLYFGLGIPITLENFLLFLACAILIHYNGIALGFFTGVMFDDDNSARTIGNFILLFFMLTSGGLANAGSFPPFIAQLTYISPMRYATEAFYRRVSAGIDPSIREKVLVQLGYTFGDTVCYLALVGFWLFFMFLAVLILNFRSRKL